MSNTTKSATSLLLQDWYRRDVVAIAQDLLGRHFTRGSVTLRITETEAYCGPGDSACHTSKGHTPRNEAMWGAPGHVYVYICYGIHSMLNVVTGEGTAVLIRACEPVKGLATIRRRRGGRDGRVLLTGPGKVGQALALNTGWSGHELFELGGLELREGVPTRRISRGPRVGIDGAKSEDVRATLRFADADSTWVTHRSKLRR